MNKIIFLFILLGLFAYFFQEEAYSVLTGNIIREEIKEIPLPEEFGTIKTFFCHNVDCEESLMKLFTQSAVIDCAFFDFDLTSLMDELSSKSYRLIMDNRYSGKVPLVQVHNDSRSAYMHNKFCIFDHRFILTGSMNPTTRDVSVNDNHFVVLESNTLVSNYQNEFEELWNGTFGSGKETISPRLLFNGYLVENYFCPEDSCKDHLLELISQAEQRVHFMVFSFTDSDIGGQLIDTYHQGIDVKGVFDATQAGQKSSQFHVLLEEKLPVVQEQHKGFLHHKVFIVDDTVFLGSYNPTLSGDTRNDENILIIHDPYTASLFEQEFQRLYSLAP